MQKTAERTGIKSFNQPDEVRTFEKGKVEIVSFGGATAGKGTFQPGWKWSTCVKPIAKTELCQSAHFGYQVSGRMTVHMADGKEFTLRAGDVMNIPPGHDAWVEGSEPVVCLDFQGMTNYAKAK